MAKRSVTGRKAKSARKEQGPIIFQPGKGLCVNGGTPPWPADAGDKIVCAKSIIQAVVAAHNACALEGQNYDLAWPLGLAVSMLELAREQMEARS